MYSREHIAYLKRKKREKRIILISQLLIIILFIVLWQLLTDKELINSFIFSSPKKVFQTIYLLFINRHLTKHILITVLETIISFSLKINNIIIISFLYYHFYMIIKNYKYIKERYILERYLYKFPYRKIKYNNNYNKNYFMQETYHYFNYISEDKVLDTIYKGNV